LSSSVPGYLKKAQNDVKHLSSTWDIDAVICLSVGAAEIALGSQLPKILDFCDSGTLTLRRMLAHRGNELTFFDKAGYILPRLRLQNMEKEFLQGFDHTTTISVPDKSCLLEVSGVAQDRVSVLPNGVSDDALNVTARGWPRRRSVVFWGNLDFAPNWTAIRYFHDEIFIPYLAERQIEWHIYGNGANFAVRQMSEHPLIHLHGFVEDLFNEVASHGVMINPMVEGSGLKNKVLEAFACQIPVVSTSLGIEAIGGQPGVHFLPGDTAYEFARSTLRLLTDQECASTLIHEARNLVDTKFLWSVVGRQFDEVIEHVLSNRESKVDSSSAHVKMSSRRAQSK
jgi:glycosyltransferase involved in cell wall biosynthesis